VSPLVHRRLSDEALGGRLASGAAAAFDELYRRYAHRLAAYGAHLLGDAASGDDVAHSALLKAYAALRDGRIPERMRPWLFRIAHNAAIDLVARRRELPSAELPDRPAHEPQQRPGALVEALATLPERQRHVYVLREVHGLRIDETGAALGLTSVQVEQALFAARNRLAEHLTFGERLNCVAVQRLASGPLDGDERRALKTHLRSCSACRSTLGLRGRALSLLPAAGLDWLRGLASTLVGGGAPVAAKVGAVVATATVAAGVPSVVQDAPPHPRVLADAAVPRVHHAAHRHVVPQRHVVVAAPAPAAAAVRHVVVARTQVARSTHDDTSEARRESDPRTDGSDGETRVAPPARTSTDGGGDSGSSDGGDGGSGGGSGSGGSDGGGGGD
jgi:RNA polymerase sigma-70 factor (ECF subfamily)